MATKKQTQQKPDDAAAEDEAEDEAGQDGAPAQRKLPRLSLKTMMIAAGGIVAIAVIGGGAYHFLGGRSEAAPSPAMAKPAVFLDMPEILVNLSNGGSERTQYLKVKVTLELPDQGTTAQVEPVMPRLQDAFQTYLRELRPTDLDGSAGLYRLKEELTRRVNAAIAPGRINAVLFKEIVIQ